MEGLQKNESGAEMGYNREAVASTAAEEAKRLFAEHIDDSLSLIERVEAAKALMTELAEDNKNRHVVEALAQRLSVEVMAHDYQEVTERYPLAA